MVTTTDFIAVRVAGLFLALWVVGCLVFYPGKDAGFKRWLWPRYVIGAAVLLGLSAAGLALASGSIWAIL